MVRIILADDHQMFRQGLESILKSHPEFEIVGNASNGHQVLALLRTTAVDIVVLDISMPEMDGLETAKQIKKTYPELRILILSMHSEWSYIKELRKIGVHGFLLKDGDKSELVEAIKTLVLYGREFFRIQDGIKPSDETEDPGKFTKRETDVLRGLAMGKDYQTIADEMSILKSTIATYMKSIRAKTGLADKAAIVRYAIEHGFGNPQK